MPPEIDSNILSKVKQEIEEEKTEKKKIPVPPPVSTLKFQKIVKKLIEAKKKLPPPAPVMNYKLLREAKEKVDK